MGNFFGRRGKTKEEIKSDIDKINNITKNELFNKKTTYILIFRMKENFFNKLIGNSVIECEIVKFKNKSHFE